MSNPSFADGRIKIGKSDRDPTTRKEELETTGVPEPFIVEYYAFVEDHHRLERELHRYFSSFRPNKNREFFTCSIPEVINVVRDKSVILHEKVNYKSPEEIEKIRLEKAKKKELEQLEEDKKNSQRIYEKKLQAWEEEKKQFYNKWRLSIVSLFDSFYFNINKKIEDDSRNIFYLLFNFFLIVASISVFFGVLSKDFIFYSMAAALGFYLLAGFFYLMHSIYDKPFQVLRKRHYEQYLENKKIVEQKLFEVESKIKMAKIGSVLEDIVAKYDYELRKIIKGSYASDGETVSSSVQIARKGLNRIEFKYNNNESSDDFFGEKYLNPENEQHDNQNERVKLVQVTCRKCSLKYQGILNRHNDRTICPACSVHNIVNIKW